MIGDQAGNTVLRIEFTELPPNGIKVISNRYRVTLTPKYAAQAAEDPTDGAYLQP